MIGLFVTGTDTNIGKTSVCAALLHRYRRIANLRYWKPVQTGSPEDDDTATARALGQCSDAEICMEGVRLPRPLSPHLAARLHGEEIHLQQLLAPAEKADGSRAWIVEGAGGVLVPLNASRLMIDLIAALGLPTLVVARSSLGTINHTLLTLEALRARGQKVAGVVMVGDSNPENRRAIEQYGNIAVIGEMPFFSLLTPNSLADWALRELDPQGVLESIFTEARRG